MPLFFSNKYFSKFNYISIIFILIISLFFIPIIYSLNIKNVSDNNRKDSYKLFSNVFIWPIPGYTNISSYFGKREAPTVSASIYHSGIDIPAPEGTSIFAIEDGIISFASWGAGGGYTIILDLEKFDGLSISYCHVSPIFVVKRGQYIKKGELIGYVGPKNVYEIENNPYKDLEGKPTNGATTGCHLHFTIKENGKCVNPLSYYIENK